MEILIIYLPRPYLYLECIELCNHIFVILIACIVVLVVLHVLVFPSHFHRFVIILNYDMSAINVYMKLFKTKPDRKALPLYMGISSFNINKYFTNKCNGFIVFEECSMDAKFTGISLPEYGLDAIIICQSGLEKCVTNPGISQNLVCGGILVPICYLLSKEGSFGGKGREKWLQVTN